jgi:hypothetical protein
MLAVFSTVNTVLTIRKPKFSNGLEKAVSVISNRYYFNVQLNIIYIKHFLSSQ